MNGMARALVAAIAVVFSGCGGDLILVRGTVQREGKPLASGRVVFVPIGGGSAAYGEIRPDGAFQLETEGRSGAPPGAYRLLIVQTKLTDTGPSRTTYVPPRDVSWQVTPGETAQIVIDMRDQDGWTIDRDD